jgi:3-methyl-2-oxobutanoate hydroxymethyltransferase
MKESAKEPNVPEENGSPFTESPGDFPPRIAPGRRVRVADLLGAKQSGKPIVMLTAYDSTFAALADEAGVDIVLVGDTVGVTQLGFETTIPVTLDHMVHHCAAVSRCVQHALVVGDMPFMSYKISAEEALHNASRLVQEGGAQAVKVEGSGDFIADITRRLVECGIPVMGHIGLLPQSVHATSGYRVQGRDPQQADALIRRAQLQQESGAFAMVLEAIPRDLAGRITAALAIPTIGIGAGNACDGQVLVLHDLLGLTHTPPRFARKYANLRNTTLRAVRQWARDVRVREFPDAEHSYE